MTSRQGGMGRCFLDLCCSVGKRDHRHIEANMADSYLNLLQAVGRVDGDLKDRVGVKVQHDYLSVCKEEGFSGEVC